MAAAHAQIPSGVTDVSAATPEAKKFFTSFFTAKSRHDVEATMKHFSPQLVTYTDATLGWPFDSHAAVKGGFTEYMPKWPASGLSYPTRILGNTKRDSTSFDTYRVGTGALLTAAAMRASNRLPAAPWVRICVTLSMITAAASAGGSPPSA